MSPACRCPWRRCRGSRSPAAPPASRTSRLPGNTAPPAWRRERRRLQIDRLARRALHLWPVNQAVAARPQRVIRFWQIGDQIAAPIVGDDDLGIPGRQIHRLGNDPDAGFRTVGAGDGAANLVVLDGRLLRERRTAVRRRSSAKTMANTKIRGTEATCRRGSSGKPSHAAIDGLFAPSITEACGCRCQRGYHLFSHVCR